MKLSKDILDQFDLDPVEEREPINVMKLRDMLDFLEYNASRIHQKSQLYLSTDDPNLQIDCLDIVTAKLNDFAQVFRDLVTFLLKERGQYKNNPSLRYSIASYDTFDFHQTQAEELFLQELLLRNEITHDYFNRELHQQKLIWIMTNCSEGAMDIHHNLENYCKQHGLMDKFAENNA